MPADPFDIDLPHSSTLRRAVLTAARPILSRALGLDEVRRRYRALPRESGRAFESLALDAVGVDVSCPDSDLGRLPPHGPVVVVANHPHGVLDGLALIEVVRRVRPDVRLVVNHLLARIPELHASSFFVDPFEGPAAAARSRAGLRAAHLWLRAGGLVILFPAGEVAPSPGEPGGAPRDARWRDTAARLALATGATVVPARIEGRNTRLFYAAGRIHPRLRTALLARELLASRGRSVAVRIGDPLPPRPVHEPAVTAQALTTQARTAVESLGRLPRMESDAIGREVEALPDSCRLVASGVFEVLCAVADQIPQTLLEIGRLREVTYRAVGEGTSRDLDLDQFDASYRHLFVWDRQRRLVVGAYRLGLTDEIVDRSGVEGLYTRTLFRYERPLVDRLGPAIELGRSFVRAEYQRHHSALLLLWKGIGAFVARHPRYRVLFGPVSISRRYSNLSRSLLCTYLERQHLDGPLASLVEACHPLAPSPEPVAFVPPDAFDDVQRIVSSLESDGKGVPVLLRQYLKLNARVLGFNVDAAFSDVVDALMVVDLRDVRPSLLKKYLGPEAAAVVVGEAAREAA